MAKSPKEPTVETVKAKVARKVLPPLKFVELDEEKLREALSRSPGLRSDFTKRLAAMSVGDWIQVEGEKDRVYGNVIQWAKPHGRKFRVVSNGQFTFIGRLEDPVDNSQVAA